MTRLLTKLRNQGLVSDFHIYVVEQSSDGRKFNRGKLLNIGFDLARKRVGSSRRHDVYIFHDVDLLPQDDLGHWYAKFPVKPIHIARVWNRYSNNPKYVVCLCLFVCVSRVLASVSASLVPRRITSPTANVCACVVPFPNILPPRTKGTLGAS
jgi:hypothetical protein